MDPVPFVPFPAETQVLFLNAVKFFFAGALIFRVFRVLNRRVS